MANDVEASVDPMVGVWFYDDDCSSVSSGLSFELKWRVREMLHANHEPGFIVGSRVPWDLRRK